MSTVITQTAAGTYSWTCPTGVTSVKVECWGGGGGGSLQSGPVGLGVGGGGGEYATQTITVVPGNSYTYVVGAGGAAGGSPGGTGGNSTFNTTTVVAHGGAGATTGSTDGGVGGTGSTNTTHFNGGLGGGAGNTSGGGGAGSGGTASAGNPGSKGTTTGNGAGGAAVAGGGPGGTHDASPTSGPGGGGGGSSAGAGKAGAAGQVRITYTLPSPAPGAGTTYNWSVPAGVTSVLVECWGAGGGGAGGGATAGGGGGGGEYAADTISVGPGDVFQYVIGTGGAVGASAGGAGGNGGDTTFDGTAVVAHGGSGATAAGGAGGAGGTGSTDSVHRDGGAGATGGGATGGGGGGSGGTSAAGNAGSGTTGGAAVAGGGPGGNGATVANGSAPSSGPGGGGGGGTGATSIGGGGSTGKIAFTYTIDASVTYPVVELLVGDTWTDISSYVYYRDRISVTRGRSDETSQANPSQCTFTLDNRDGRFSPRNPMGAYYGLIGRNTQVRVWVARNGVQYYRFWGEISAWPVQWDISGKDVYVKVTASGIKRRMQQGSAPIKSAVYRDMTSPTRTAIVGYWPMEDVAGSTAIASGLDGAQPMRITTGAADFGAYSDWFGSDPLPTMGTAVARGIVPTYTPTGATSIRFFCKVNTAVPATYQELIRLKATGTAAIWTLSLKSDGALRLTATDVLDNTLLNSGDANFAMNTAGMRTITIQMVQNGANIDWQLITTDIANSDAANSVAPTLTLGNTITGATVGRITEVMLGANGGLGDVALGHTSVGTSVGAYASSGRSLAAWNDENPASRFGRLCAEEGINGVTVSNGATGNTTSMGSQHSNTLINLLEDCEVTDLGMLYEPRDQVGLAYRTRLSLYNQAARLALDYSAHQLADALNPVDDDQKIRNDITLARRDGSSVRQVLTVGPLSVNDPPGGVGRYDDAPPAISLGTDAQLDDQAGFRLLLGTVDEARYPQIALNLAHPVFTANSTMMAAALTMDIGDRITIDNPPAWLPPDQIDLIGQGYTETFDQFEYNMTVNCAPGSPYRVAVYGTDRYDTAGSQLTADITASALSIPVTTTPGPLWTTDAADMPFDIRAGGERMTVSAVGPSVSDVFTRTTSNGWGSATSGQAWTANGTASDFSVSSGLGKHTHGAVNLSRWTTVPHPIGDFDVRVDLGTDALAVGSSQFAYVAGRFNTTSNNYMARVEIRADATINLSLRKTVSGTETQLAAVVTALTHVANTMYRCRFRGQGSGLLAKLWRAVDPEPNNWQVAATDTDITGIGDVGVRSILGTTNTNPLPVSFIFDNFATLHPQTFTVTRSVNGVVNSHPAGASVSLWSPAFYAL